MLEKINFMAMERSLFINRVEYGMYQFFANLLKIYLINNQTNCFNHWVQELVNTYLPLRDSKNKNNKKYTYSDIITVFEEDLDISDLHDTENFVSKIQVAIDEVNDSENTSFTIHDVNINEIRSLIFLLLSKTCSSDWNKSTISKILNDFNI